METVLFDPWQYKVLDGGFATQLAKLGCADFDDDPLWSCRKLITHPDSVKEVHARFLKAGADVVSTNTYHCNVDTLMKQLDLSEEGAKDVLRKGVALARAARDEFNGIAREEKPLVAGSVGPYAVYFADASEYHGNYVDKVTIEELKNWHRPRLAVLLEAGVDLIAFETIPAQKEAQALCDLIKEFPEAKAWLTFSIKEGGRTVHGESLSDCARLVADHGQMIGMGVNCCAPANVVPALEALGTLSGKKALIVYPNSGETWTSEHEWIGKAEAAPLCTFVPQWLEMGATWIGGCCRVYESDIADIRKVMD